jgi:hypothetical protein
MSPSDIAAYIGAAAWLPQIVGWIWGKLAVPEITVISDRSLEIGFTRFGPIFNLRMAFSSDKKNAIVDSFYVHLTHEDGETHRLRWVGMNENVSEIIDHIGNRQVISKEQTAIGFKVGTESLLEKFVRFQEDRFWMDTQSPYSQLLAHFSFLKSKDPDYITKTLQSKEYHDVVEAHKRAFWWKPGVWFVKFTMGSPHKLKVRPHLFKFRLTQFDVDALKLNLAEIDREFENIVESNKPDYKLKPVTWNWRSPALLKGEEDI